MAQITLNVKSNSQEFALNDADILYVMPLYDEAGDTDGAILTIIDTASAVTTTITVEETPAQVGALTTAIVQLTTTMNESPYFNKSRIKDVFQRPDSSDANFRYDDNGNVFAVIKTDMTVAEILAEL
jgi:hypothetical protein